MIRPKLEYAEVIRSPHKKKHVLKLERMQRIGKSNIRNVSNNTQRKREKRRLNYII